MIRIKKFCNTLVLATAALTLVAYAGTEATQTASASATASRPVITMDAAYLAIAKQRVANNDPALKPAYDKLILDANAVLKLPPETVTRKNMMPPTGSKNDYISLAPYFWPDPAKPDGLPYISHDGKFNPSAKNNDSDSVRMQVMCLGLQSASMAYYFTGDHKYSKKAADIIRIWFLNPATRMNPNLEYGQMIMGTGKGRGYGLVDTRNLWMVIDGALIVAESGDFSAEDMAGFKQWFVDFTHWMTDSDLAQDEFNQVNNHGTYYDMQLANYALFIGDTKLAKRAVKRTQTLRMGFQIASDGKQAFELGRTTPFHYSAFNLDAIANVARYAEQVGVDVWRAKEKGGGFRNALNYLVPFVVNPETWTYKELNGKPEIELAQPVLLRAERAYGKDSYAAAAAKVPEILLTTQEYLALYAAINLPAPTTFTVVDKLIWPVK